MVFGRSGMPKGTVVSGSLNEGLFFEVEHETVMYINGLSSRHLKSPQSLHQDTSYAGKHG